MTATRSHLWGSGAPTASQGEDDSTPRPFRQRRNCSNVPGLQPRLQPPAQVETEVSRTGYQPESRLQVGGSGKLRVSVCVSVCVCVCVCLCVLVAQPCPTLCDPMNYSLPGSSVHGILQARKPEKYSHLYSQSWGINGYLVPTCLQI